MIDLLTENYTLYQKSNEKEKRKNPNYKDKLKLYESFLKALCIDHNEFYIVDITFDGIYIGKKSDHKIGIFITLNEEYLSLMTTTHFYSDSKEELDISYIPAINIISSWFPMVEHKIKHDSKIEVHDIFRKQIRKQVKSEFEYGKGEVKGARMGDFRSEEEAQAKYQMKVNSKYLTFKHSDLFLSSYITTKIIFFKIFDKELSLEDYYFIRKLKTDIFLTASKKSFQSVLCYQDIILFDKQNRLTKESKELLELNFQY